MWLDLVWVKKCLKKRLKKRSQHKLFCQKRGLNIWGYYKGYYTTVVMFAGIPKHWKSDKWPWQIPDIWCTGDETKQSRQWWLKYCDFKRSSWAQSNPLQRGFGNNSKTFAFCVSAFERMDTHTGVSRVASHSALLCCAPQSVCDQGHGGPNLFPGCVGFIHHQRGSSTLESERAAFVQAFAV